MPPAPGSVAEPHPAVVIRKVPRAAAGEPAAAPTEVEPAPAAGPAAVAPHRHRSRLVAAALVLALLLGAFAVVAAFEPGVDKASSTNTALVDTAATDEVGAAAVQAVQKTYSYTFGTIDADVAAATALMTPDMAAQHAKNIATIKDAVTQAKTTSKAQVTADGVRTLQGDRAEVVAFVVVTSDNGGTALAPVPLRFTAQMQKVDGAWKLSGLVPS